MHCRGSLFMRPGLKLLSFPSCMSKAELVVLKLQFAHYFLLTRLIVRKLDNVCKSCLKIMLCLIATFAREQTWREETPTENCSESTV